MYDTLYSHQNNYKNLPSDAAVDSDDVMLSLNRDDSHTYWQPESDAVDSERQYRISQQKATDWKDVLRQPDNRARLHLNSVIMNYLYSNQDTDNSVRGF